METGAPELGVDTGVELESIVVGEVDPCVVVNFELDADGLEDNPVDSRTDLGVEWIEESLIGVVGVPRVLEGLETPEVDKVPLSAEEDGVLIKVWVFGLVEGVLVEDTLEDPDDAE